MWNLEYELIAILMLVAIIGVLMGRFLCKSNETEERIDKEKVMLALKSTKHELEQSESYVQEQSSVITHQRETLSEFEEDNHNLTMRLSSSESARQKLLEELKELEKYKSRFESIAKEFDLQSEQLDRLKEEKVTHIETIEVQTSEITLLQERVEEFDSMVDLKQKQEQKLKEMYKLNETSLNAINDMSDQREQLSDELEESQEEIKRLEDLLYEREEDFGRLYKEFISYKKNVTTNRDRLNYLEKAYEEMSKTFNTVLAERDDLVSRIRAISSVVGSADADGHEASS